MTEDVWSKLDSFTPHELATPAGQAAASEVLQALSSAQQPSPAERSNLVRIVLAALGSESVTGAPQALSLLVTTLKFLGRVRQGAEQLAESGSTRLLLEIGGLARLGQTERSSKPATGAILLPPATEDDNDEDKQERLDNGIERLEPNPLQAYEMEALRCLCNALTLFPQAREAFPDVLDDERGRSALRGMAQTLACDGVGFLSGRLLFLLTSQPSKHIETLVEQQIAVAAMHQYAVRFLNTLRDPQTASMLTAGPIPTRADTLKEHLKLAYNLGLQYSRTPAPDSASLRAQGPYGGARRASAGSETGDQVGKTDDAGSSPSKSKRFAGARRIVEAVKTGSRPSSRSSSPARRPSTTAEDETRPTSKLRNGSREDGDGNSGALSLEQAVPFLPLFKPYLTLCCFLPLGDDPKEPSSLVRSAFNALLNFPVEMEELDGFDNSWTQPVAGSDGVIDRTSLPQSMGRQDLPPLVARLMEVVRKTCGAYLPSDKLPPSGQSSRNKGDELPAHPDDLLDRSESSRFEEILGPVMLLLRKLTLLAEPAFLLKEMLLPKDIDRSIPLDRRPDLIGQLIRLSSSILLPNTAYGVSEFLYNLCDRDPEKLSLAIGYGNASGMLQNRGELIAPPVAASPDATRADSGTKANSGSAVPVNPITGAVEERSSAMDELARMTDEEKEREAEKLYVLFDRMNRTGVMSTVENPVDKAKKEGKLEQSRDEQEAERRRLEQEDDELEREVERELAAYKERKKGAGSV